MREGYQQTGKKKRSEKASSWMVFSKRSSGKVLKNLTKMAYNKPLITFFGSETVNVPKDDPGLWVHLCAK